MSFEVVWSEKKKKMVKKYKKDKVDNLKGTEVKKDISDEYLKTYIRNEYFRINEFDTKILNKEIPLSRKNRDISVDVYIEFLDDYLNRIRNGRIPDRTYIISAPDGFGKKVFAYQVIKDSLAYGLRPTELFSTHELYEYLDKMDYANLYQKFEDKDLALITLGGAPSKTSLIVIKTIIEHCEREGIPLLILSRFEPEFFIKRDPMSRMYLGLRETRRGDFGKAKLKGFNAEDMNKIRKEFEEGNTSKDKKGRDSFRRKD